MSISEFSLSSPRKPGGKNDKSITYDEEFDKFLNDTSESDISNLKLGTKETKPWWMKEDGDGATSTLKTTKSFMKQTKPSEENDPTLEYRASVIRDPQLKKVTTFKLDEDIQQDLEETLPRLNLDNQSTMSSFQNESINKRDYDQDDFNEDDESSGPGSSSRRSQVSTIAQKTILNNANDVAATNLLSKVMFMDTVDTLGNQTTKNSEDSDIQIRGLATQTRRDLADLENVYRNLSSMTDSGLNTMLKTVSPGSSGQRLEPIESIQSGDSDFGLQTINAIRTELENRALQEILNEMDDKRTRVVAQKPDVKKRVEKKQPTRPTASSIAKSANNNNNRRENVKKTSSSSGVSSGKNEDSSKSSWPPKKYQHVSGSGYGTTWKPITMKRGASASDLHNQSRASNNRSRSTSSQRQEGGRNYSADSSFHARPTLSVGDLRGVKSSESIIDDLKDQLIRATDHHQDLMKQTRLTYESKIKELESINADLTNQIKERDEKISILKTPVITEEDESKLSDVDKKMKKQLEDRIAQLEKELSEQDKLIKGYQTENEIIYAELKTLREARQKETSKFETERNELKLNLIQERQQKLRHSGDKQQSKQSKSSPERKIILPITVETQTAQIEFENRVKYFMDKNKELEQMNNNLKKLIGYYEKNQQQIEQDVIVINEKNKEIKSLSEKVSYLEKGRAVPDYVKEVRMLKSQLKEMDQALKRLNKRGSGSSTSNNKDAINLSLNYYENRIEKLEKELKDKTLEVERFNQMWKQKFYMLNELKNFDEFENMEQTAQELIKRNATEFDVKRNYMYRIKVLEDLIIKLKKEVAVKTAQLEDSKTGRNRSRSAERAAKPAQPVKVTFEQTSRSYDEKKFQEKSEPAAFDSEFTKTVLQEVDELRNKLDKAHKEIKINEHEYELRLERLKRSYESNLNEMKEKHSYEVDKLLKVLMNGSPATQIPFDNGKLEFIKTGIPMSSPLDDPAYIRLLMKASENYRDKTVENLKLENLALIEKISELKLHREKSRALEESNQILRNKLAQLENELDELRHNGSSFKDQAALRNKINTIESRCNQRERDIDSLLDTNAIRPIRDNSCCRCNQPSSDQYDVKIKQMTAFYESQIRLKNKEIEKFRYELDTMLALLNSLKNQ